MRVSWSAESIGAQLGQLVLNRWQWAMAQLVVSSSFPSVHSSPIQLLTSTIASGCSVAAQTHGEGARIMAKGHSLEGWGLRGGACCVEWIDLICTHNGVCLWLCGGSITQESAMGGTPHDGYPIHRPCRRQPMSFGSKQREATVPALLHFPVSQVEPTDDDRVYTGTGRHSCRKARVSEQTPARAASPQRQQSGRKLVQAEIGPICSQAGPPERARSGCRISGTDRALISGRRADERFYRHRQTFMP